MSTTEQVIRWLVKGDTGISSIAIVSHITGYETDRKFSDYPSDAGDFGRCYRLLVAVPEFRSRIGEMASRSPQWSALVAEWDELERLYESNGGTCYRRMTEILDAAKNNREVKISDGVSIEFPCGTGME